MCGRYTQTSNPHAIAERFGIDTDLPTWQPSWNVAPSQEAPVVRLHPQTRARHLDLLRWGLLPHGAGPKSPRPINARAETLANSPFFRGAFASRRAVVPADAFYEWRREGKSRQPHAIARADGAPLAFAGLWEGWRGPDGTVVRSFAIVTTAANAEMAAIHDRMPLILEADTWPVWLQADPGDAARLLHPPRDFLLRLWPVSPRVNAAAANGPDLLAPFAAA